MSTEINTSDQGSLSNVMQGYSPSDGRSKYRSPLVARYCSKEMSYNWSEMKKFSTWRRLWVNLAKAEKVGTSFKGTESCGSGY